GLAYIFMKLSKGLLLLFVYRQYRNFALVDHAFGMHGLEQLFIKTMMFGSNDDHVDLFVCSKKIDRFVKVEKAHEIEFRLELSKQALHFIPFFLKLCRQGYIMAAVNI